MTTRRRRAVRTCVAVGALLAIVWLAGFLRFATTLPAPGGDATRTDAIVVLTGGSGRLATGFDLLSANRAAKLFVSGVSPNIDPMELAALADARTDQVDCCVMNSAK